MSSSNAGQAARGGTLRPDAGRDPIASARDQSAPGLGRVHGGECVRQPVFAMTKHPETSAKSLRPELESKLADQKLRCSFLEDDIQQRNRKLSLVKEVDLVV